MGVVVLVFDFDQTIIDCDSDEWVVNELGIGELFRQLLPSMTWNTLMVCIKLIIYIEFK
ncbi:putative Acid phosphatase [Dioscorea sansibarensis]